MILITRCPPSHWSANSLLAAGQRAATGGRALLAKRLIDLGFALAGLVLASPVFILVALTIRVTSSGPAIFVQDRVGQHETRFRCLKFRTMVSGSPDIPSHDASASWVTPAGKFLRRTKLDELPQLINVIRGEMSLVGPRPCLPSQVELVTERRIRRVFDARPGITGAAQLAGIDMSDPARLAQVDAEYVRSRSILGDLWLIALTVVGGGTGDSVVK